MSVFTLKVVAFTPPNVTLLVCVRLTPLIVTGVPTLPLGGVKLVICGVTWKITLLLSVPLGVVTSTVPVVAPAGTVVLISVPEATVNVAAVLLKLTLTLVVPVRLFPKIRTGAPTFAELGTVCTNGPRPTDRLYIVPRLSVPPG